MKWKIILLLGIAFILGILLYRSNFPTQQATVQKIFGGQQNYDAFATSTNVTAQLLHRRSNVIGEAPDAVKLIGYNIDPPCKLTSSQVEQIQNLLKTPSSYTFSIGEKACVPDYGILFNFRSNQKTIRVALCIKCKILAVFLGEDDNSGQIGGGDFDPSCGQFISLAKAIFPNDPEIQALRESR